VAVHAPVSIHKANNGVASLEEEKAAIVSSALSVMPLENV